MDHGLCDALDAVEEVHVDGIGARPREGDLAPDSGEAAAHGAVGAD